MRRLLGIPLLVAGLAACGTHADSSAGKQSAPPRAASGAPSKARAGAAPANTTNPCKLVTAEDLKKIFLHATSVTMVTADGYDPDNPPANGSLQERNCGYTVTVAGMFGDNPNTDSSTQFTVMVTTYGEVSGGTTWKAITEGAQMATTGPAGVAYRPVTNIGDAAFFSGTGDLTAHKGTVIVHVWSADDVNGILDNQKAAAVTLQALTHATS